MTGKARRAAQDRLDRAATNPHGVKVGQVWKDNDPRCMTGRRLLIQSINGAFAQCALLTWMSKPNTAVNARGELRRENYPQIRLDRFNGTRSGYALEKDVTPVAAHDSDCAVHNAPAYDPGPCDCGAGDHPTAPDGQDQ